jgi:hypothetical protein
MMISATLQASALDMPVGFVLDATSLASIIDNINETSAREGSSFRITSYRREAAELMTLKMDPHVFDALFQHYRAYTWERSFMNASILRCRHWGVGVTLVTQGITPQGPWTSVYTTSAASSLRLATTCINMWTAMWSPEKILALPIKEVQSARLKDEVIIIALRCCAFDHWALPLVEAQY